MLHHYAPLSQELRPVVGRSYFVFLRVRKLAVYDLVPVAQALLDR
jgi:hypothetical protein